MPTTGVLSYSPVIAKLTTAATFAISAVIHFVRLDTVTFSTNGISSPNMERICLNMRHALLYVTPVSRSICFAEIPHRVDAIR